MVTIKQQSNPVKSFDYNKLFEDKFITAAKAQEQGRIEAKKNRVKNNRWAAIRYKKAAKIAREVDLTKINANYNMYLLPYRRNLIDKPFTASYIANYNKNYKNRNVKFDKFLETVLKDRKIIKDVKYLAETREYLRQRTEKIPGIEHVPHSNNIIPVPNPRTVFKKVKFT